MKKWRPSCKKKQMTARPEKYPQGNFKEKSCRWCGNIFQPLAPSHLYCSTSCGDEAYTDTYYRKSYGVGVLTVRKICKLQEDKCAICRKTGFKMRDIHEKGINLDHCHITGAVRGLLCHNCNRALGLLKDNVQSLKNAIKYLESEFDFRRDEESS